MRRRSATRIIRRIGPLKHRRIRRVDANSATGSISRFDFRRTAWRVGLADAQCFDGCISATNHRSSGPADQSYRARISGPGRATPILLNVASPGSLRDAAVQMAAPRAVVLSRRAAEDRARNARAEDAMRREDLNAMGRTSENPITSPRRHLLLPLRRSKNQCADFRIHVRGTPSGLLLNLLSHV